MSITSTLSPNRMLTLDGCSTLGKLSDSLLRLGRLDVMRCLNEAYICGGEGRRLIMGPSGGRHAAKRPMETSTVVQNEGGVRFSLVALSEGWK